MWIDIPEDKLKQAIGLVSQRDSELAKLLIDQWPKNGENEQAYRVAAKEFGEEGELEFDEDAVVIASNDGAYVMAWQWVDKTELTGEEDDDSET